MKFSNSLRFNAVADWWDEYIAYSALKKHIYQLEKVHVSSSRRLHDLESSERTALMEGDRVASPTDSVFIPLLDHELMKICDFYELQEKTLLQEVTELEELVKAKEEEGSEPRHYMDADDDDDDDDDEEHAGSRSRERPYGGAGRSSRQRRISGPRSRVQAPALSHLASLSTDSAFSRRRHSVSSSEDNLDLEASLASLSQIPEDVRPGPSDGRTSLDSPKRTRAAKLANIFNLVKPTGSVSSSSGQQDSIWTSKSNYAYDTRVLFKRRITNLHNALTSLKAYVELNYSGFRKILKKYDKITYSELKDQYMHNVVEEAYPFRQSTKDHLNEAIGRLVALYAKCITLGDVSLASRQLRAQQREQIAWERDTVWRQMISQSRRGESDGQVKSLGGHVESEEESALLEVATPAGRFKLKGKHISLAVALLVFLILLNVPTVDGVPAQNCLSVLVFATILWATEAIPLFVTSLFVPLLLVCLRVFVDAQSEERLSTPAATTYVFSQMFSPTIMLLIGGFTIASALSKTNIDRILITRVLSLAGTRPSIVLLTFMGVSCFASMWISNVAAPTLCFTLIKPIMRTLPPKSSFAPCLILGIALAANIGGQSSPISSPQNIIALAAMDDPIDWLNWFAVALPVSGISLLLIWLLLLVSYRPTKTIDGEDLVIREIRPTHERFTLKQYWVTFVCLVTIALWCVEKQIEEYVGDMGIIAIIPIVAFFSTGVLRKDDFEQFLWTIVFIAMGGIALGKGVTSSGLMEILRDEIGHILDGLHLYTVVMVLSFVVLVVSTFISHTIASVLLVPIAKEVGSKLQTLGDSGHDYSRILIFLTGLVCSTGMGMPVSGFPNQTAATQENEMGQMYLTNIDFLKNGVPASIIAALVVATIGFLLMKATGV